MLVKRIHYPLTTLGPGVRVGIWCMGCNKRCKGCMSKDLQLRDEKYQREVSSILQEIKEYYITNNEIGITITGGEPFLQEDLDILVKGIKEMGIKDILLYSGYTYEELIVQNKEYVKNALTYISVLIDGEYIEELNDNKSLRGSSNQRILFFDTSLIDKYKPNLNRKREFEVVDHGEYLDFYGIFPKGMEESIKKAFTRNNIEFISSND